MNIKKKALENRINGRWAGSKGEALKVYQAAKNHKKLPEFKRQYKGKNPEFAKLSIEEYERKYPTFKD